MSRHATVAQVARWCRCRPKTVREWIATGVLRSDRCADGHRVPFPALRELVVPACDHPRIRCPDQGQPGTKAGPTSRYDGPDLLLEQLMNADHLSLAEAAAYINRSTRTVRRWVEEGRLPNSKRVVQRLLIPKADLDALVQPARPELVAV